MELGQMTKQREQHVRRRKGRSLIPPTPVAPNISGVMLEMYLLYMYGPRLDMEQLAAVLRIARSTVANRICSNTFPIRTYLDVGGRYADYRDVAQHLDRCRREAEKAVKENEPRSYGTG